MIIVKSKKVKLSQYRTKEAISESPLFQNEGKSFSFLFSNQLAKLKMPYLNIERAEHIYLFQNCKAKIQNKFKICNVKNSNLFRGVQTFNNPLSPQKFRIFRRLVFP